MPSMIGHNTWLGHNRPVSVAYPQFYPLILVTTNGLLKDLIEEVTNFIFIWRKHKENIIITFYNVLSRWFLIYNLKN